jgi:hypothetical protein
MLPTPNLASFHQVEPIFSRVWTICATRISHAVERIIAALLPVRMIFGLLQSCLLTTMTTVPVNHRFVRYRLAQDGIPKIGLVDKEELNVAEVLGYADLFKLIEAHPSLAGDYKFTTGEVSPLKSVEILAPLPGRDIL